MGKLRGQATLTSNPADHRGRGGQNGGQIGGKVHIFCEDYKKFEDISHLKCSIQLQLCPYCHVIAVLPSNLAYAYRTTQQCISTVLREQIQSTWKPCGFRCVYDYHVIQLNTRTPRIDNACTPSLCYLAEQSLAVECTQNQLGQHLEKEGE